MKFPILISYAYARKNLDSFHTYVNHPDVDVLLDSGAFTAKSTGEIIELSDYCRFLDEYRDRLFAYLALDVVGNPAATDVNLKEMLAQGYGPVPVHVLGDGQRRMDELFEMSDYVALAGLKRPGKGHCSKEYLKQKMLWARGRQVHWLGYVREPMFRTFRPYSVDSSSWTYGTRYGWLALYLGRGQWAKKVRYPDRNDIADDARVIAVLERCGWTREQFNDPRQWRELKENGLGRCLPQDVTADSWISYVIDVQNHFGVRVFMACSLAGDGEQYCILKGIGSHVHKLYLHDKVAS